MTTSTTTSLEDARKIETEFLAAVDARLASAKGWLPGSTFRVTRGDERDRLRELMKGRRMFDAKLLDRLPNNRRTMMTGTERRWFGFGRKTVGAITASVLSPLNHALELVASGLDGGGALIPIGRTELTRHLEMLTDRSVGSHVIGVCSPSGFTTEARRPGASRPDVTLVLIEPHEGGGWTVTGVSGPALVRACEFFDPEDEDRKLARVRQAVDERRGSVMSSPLNAADLAEELGLEQDLVEAAFDRIATDDGHLHVTSGERGSILFYTSTAVKEDAPMSVMDFLRRILRREASTAEKIKALEKKQAEIDDRRRDLEKNLDELVKKEGELLKEGAAASGQAVKRRLATQHAQIGREIALQNQKVSILNKQSQVLAQHIHNLEVAETARPADLPASEDITEAAAAAESALEELDETFEAVRTVSDSATEQALTEDEAASLAAFEAEAAKLAAAQPDAAEAPADTEPAEPTRSEPAPEDRRREAD